MCECVAKYGQGIRHPYSRIRLPRFLQTKLYKLHLTEFIFYLLRMHVKQTKTPNRIIVVGIKTEGWGNQTQNSFSTRCEEIYKITCGFWERFSDYERWISILLLITFSIQTAMMLLIFLWFHHCGCYCIYGQPGQTNSVDLDQNAVSIQGLHCLPLIQQFRHINRW